MHKLHDQPEESNTNQMRHKETNSDDLSYLSPADYLEQRVEHQLQWYSRRSADNKRWYNRLQLIILVSAVSVPVLALSSGDIRIRFLVALLGAVAALATGIISLYQFRDQWLDYRATAESMKVEKHLFLTRTEPYAESRAFGLFVQRIEAIINSENRSWQGKSFSLPETSSGGIDEGKVDKREVDEKAI